MKPTNSMKPTIAYLALASLVSALPCAAQTNTASGAVSPHAISPQLLQAARNLRVMSGPMPLTPKQKAHDAAILAAFNDLTQAGAEDLRQGNFVAAEADYRELIQVNPLSPYAYYGLGDALAGQGKTADAVKAYRTTVYWSLDGDKSSKDKSATNVAVSDLKKPHLRGCCGPEEAVEWLKCALLLSQAGQSDEACNIYREAFPYAADSNHPGFLPSFEVSSPDPVSFQASVHLALGVLAYYSDSNKAVSEFDKALRLQPDNALTNYYYGYGWQHLDLKSTLRTADASRAKAALQKAAASENNGVRKAASEALRDAG